MRSASRSQLRRVPPKEQYYQDMMLCLEGSLTPEKEEIILTEKARFQEAFEQISLS